MKICIFDTYDFKDLEKLPKSDVMKHGIIINDHNFVPRKGDVIVWHENKKLLVTDVVIDYGANTIYVFGKVMG